jgi:hypothetical protein
MNTIADTKKIFLTPSGATVTDSLFSSLTYNIPQLFHSDKFTMYHTIKVLHCEIPFSWYIVNDYNDKLSLSTGNITLVNGNYNANTFMVALRLLLPVGMTIDLNIQTGKFTLSYTSAFSIAVGSESNRLRNKLIKYL